MLTLTQMVLVLMIVFPLIMLTAALLTAMNVIDRKSFSILSTLCVAMIALTNNVLLLNRNAEKTSLNEIR